MWLGIQKIDKEISETTDARAKKQLELIRLGLKRNLTQRARSLLEFSDYVLHINKILSIPGLRKDFKGNYFKIFNSGRTVEV